MQKSRATTHQVIIFVTIRQNGGKKKYWSKEMEKNAKGEKKSTPYVNEEKRGIIFVSNWKSIPKLRLEYTFSFYRKFYIALVVIYDEYKVQRDRRIYTTLKKKNDHRRRVKAAWRKMKFVPKKKTITHHTRWTRI